jgi:effector-binding domain-containing protein
MQHEIFVKDVPAQHVVASRRHLPFKDIGAKFADTMHDIVKRIAPTGKWPTGAAFAIYYNQPFTPDDVDVEIGVPVASDVEVHDANAQIDSRDLPGATVASTIHEGPYAGIHAAYRDIYEWIELHGRKAAGPPREIYVVGPAQTDRATEYVTEIDVPLA